MCLRYADVERQLGEVDRARTIYTYASQFCEPRTDGDFWKIWHEFEVRHGNEETFKDMLRIRRTVQGQFAATAVTTAITAEAEKIKQRTAAQQQAARQAPNPMLDLENRARAERAAQEVRPPAQAVSNPEEIELGAEEGGGDNAESQSETADIVIQKKSVPVSVFGLPANGEDASGSSATAAESSAESQSEAAPMSVKERFNKKRQRQDV